MYPEFTYLWYEYLINQIYENGYNIANYHNYNIIDKPCILRHDIDMDLKKAADFAGVEAKARLGSNVKATYFILLSSDFYNPFSTESLRSIDKILSYGNDIGLHFDEQKYDLQSNSLTIQDYVEEELELLGRLLGLKIRVVSMHRPSKATLEGNYHFATAINSYSEEYFQCFKYLSDSRMNWRENAFEVIQSKKYDKLHILTHPFWYSKVEENTRSKLLGFINRACTDRYGWVTNNFRDIEEFINLEEVQ